MPVICAKTPAGLWWKCVKRRGLVTTVLLGLAVGLVACGGTSGSGDTSKPASTTSTQKSAAQVRRERKRARAARAHRRQERLRARRAQARKARAAAKRRRARRVAAVARRERRLQQQRQAAQRKAQQKKQQQASCQPGYDPCLKANAGDYDCESGSGDGPNYTGPVTVTGPDVFDLDRDGDGSGCE